MGERAVQRWWRAGSPWLLVACAAASLALYGSTARAGFVGDDYESLLAVAGPGRGLGWSTDVGVGGHYRPVTFATYRLDHAIGGLHPLGYHLTSIALHAVAAWLVGVVTAGLLRRAAAPDRVRSIAPLVATIAFAVSPAHGEAVRWVAARADPLLACWALAMAWAWLRYRDGAGRRFAAAAAGAFALALGTKETAVALPAVLVAHDLWLADGPRAPRRLARRLADLWPFVVLVVAYLVAYVVAEQAFLADEGDALRADGPLVRTRRLVQVLVRSVLPGMGRRGWVLVAPVVVVAGMAGIVAASRRRGPDRAPWAAIGLLATAAVATAAPVARLGVGLHDGSGERLAYLPSAFAIPALAVLAVAALEGAGATVRRVAPALGVALALVASGLLVARGRAWNEAGDLADAVVADAGSWGRDRPVLLLGAPDTLRGVPVLRNGLYPALILRHGWADPARGAAPRAYDALPVTLTDPRARVEVRPGPCARCTTLAVVGRARFARPRAGDDPGAAAAYGLTVRSLGERHAVLEHRPTEPPTAVWLLSGGRLVRLDPPG